MKSKQVLSVEQMKHLQELGLKKAVAYSDNIIKTF